MKLFQRLLAAVFLLSSLLFQASAQDATGKVTGIITDPSGGVVSNVNVTVSNIATNVSKETMSNSQGAYQVLALPIGRYKVTATAPGFQPITVESTTALEINQTLRVDIQLQVGKITGEVTVEAAASQVETENPTVGSTVTGKAIFELPLNGRDTLDLLKTQPGITEGNTDSAAAGKYSIGGMRTDSVTYLLDGGLNNGLLNNGAIADPNPDAIAEFRVLENSYTAEYGRNAGGIVSIVTKSGTNSLHGTAYDYLRNNYFNANTFFNNQQGLSVPVLKRNQFGGTIGGPITIPKIINGKDKLFFFFSYEGQRQTSLDISPGKVTTFTPAEANGDFSGADPATVAAVASFLQANPYYQANPNLAAKGIIDPARIDPVAKAYFKNGLIPTSASGYLFPQATATDKYNEYLGKFDYNITSKDSLSGTFTTRDRPQLFPFGSAGVTPASDVTGSPSDYENAAYTGTVTYNHTFTPALLNTFRFTAQRLNHHQAIPVGSQPIASQLGANLPSDQPTGAPILAFLGSNLNIGYSPQGPTTEIDNTYSLNDDLSWTVGSHNLKGGFYFNIYQNNTLYDFYINGAYYFYGPSTGVGSGVDFADFLMGNADEYLQFPKAPSNIRSHQYAGYLQDGWKVTKRLTLSLGVRYEYAVPKYDTQGRTFSFIPGLQSTRFVNAPPGLVFPFDKGAPRGSNFPDKNDWAPRFGFAYDVFGNGKTAVRGGFGMFYDILKGEDNLQFNGQLPFFSFADVFPVTYTGTGLSSLQDPFASAGAVNPFPSKPAVGTVNFADSGFLPFGGGGVYFVDPHLRTPYVFQYNLAVEQQLQRSMVLEVSYVGYDAHKLTGLVDQNPFVPGAANRVYDDNIYSYLDTFENIGKANYSALQVNLRKRTADMGKFGSAFYTLGYTWGHEIDNESGFRERNSLVPYFNHDYFRASGDTDIRNTFTFSGGWDLPFDRLWNNGPKVLTRGWSIYPILTYRTGFPLDISANISTRRSSPGPSGAGDQALVRADISGPLVTLDPHGTGNLYFDPNLFSAPDTIPGVYTYGTFPRNGLRGPTRTNLDLTVSKHFIFREGMEVELRGDAFNIVNHTEFKSPDLTLTDPTFGVVSTTYDPRILQLALHVQF